MLHDTALEDILDTARKDVKTDSYPMSIGELVGMYEKGEIILRPEYQRYFRWTHEQKSKLIESILIGLPLPSFFMAQDEKGNWEVVDGMQRLSTILDFMGMLNIKNTQHPNYTRFKELSDELFYLKEFNGKGWEDFSRRIQLDFKRTKIQITILMRETNPDAKFELFQRLNSGGTSISGQELRNAILAGENPAILTWFEELASDQNFSKTIGLPEKAMSARYDMELVLRFMVFLSEYSSDLKKFNSVDVFLTHVLRKFIEDSKTNQLDLEAKKLLFQKTFKKIADVGGDSVLKYRTAPKTGSFSISFFEAVALGIAQNIDNLPEDEILLEKINSIGNEVEYQNASGTGINVKSRIPKLSALGKHYFSRD